MYTYTRKENNQDIENADLHYMVDEASTIKSFDYNSIYRSEAFNEAMKYFDITDDMTRNVLLSVNETDQNVVMSYLASKLYQHIVDKVDEIDFGTIPLSKGDITKIDNYDKLLDCVNIITEVLQNYNQSTESIDTVSTAIQNMVDRTELFTKAYKLNVEMPIIIYNTITLSIISSVSFMISTCIEFIKLDDDKGIEIAIEKTAINKTRDNILFTDLKKFNKVCASGDFDKAMNYIMMNTPKTKNLIGGGAMFALGASGVAATLAIILLIIPIIRELIFLFYYSRTKVAEYFDAQASLLILNAYNIENNLTRDKKNKKEIANKQKKIADKFKKLANTIRVNNKVAESETKKETKKLDSKKFKQDEVLDSIPDSSNSILF